MKAVVVAEVQRFMFRQGLQERARYYGVCLPQPDGP